jgi:hypothetical protein
MTGTRYDNVTLSPLLLPARPNWSTSGMRVTLSYLDRHMQAAFIVRWHGVGYEHVK